ncbi:hypothetical protein ACFYW1_10190 [Streptomyces sp. NPDC002669]|uniref:hypothetical protein n=1 Tax=Streptomyces sp. NPDC002669 TaxID=3364658 RepID=UPI0036AD3D37
MTDLVEPVLLFDEDGRMFILHDSSLADELIESADEFCEGYDGKGRPLRAHGASGQVALALVASEAHEDKLRTQVERYYSVYAARHPTRTPPQRDDLAAFIRAVADDFVEE